MKKIFFLAGMLAFPAYAGEISKVGTAIEVESYRCEVTSQYGIQCINIGRVCEKFRAKEKERNDKIFGCAIEGSKNAPCPPWDVDQKAMKDNLNLSMMCTPLALGSL